MSIPKTTTIIVAGNTSGPDVQLMSFRKDMAAAVDASPDHSFKIALLDNGNLEKRQTEQK